MKIWVGLKQNDEYVHEWIGEVSDGDVPNAIRDALADYAKNGKPLWGMNIMVDKARPGAVAS